MEEQRGWLDEFSVKFIPICKKDYIKVQMNSSVVLSHLKWTAIQAL